MITDESKKFLITQLAFFFYQNIEKQIDDIDYKKIQGPAKELVRLYIDWIPKYFNDKNYYRNLDKYVATYKFSYDAYEIVKNKTVNNTSELHVEHNPPKKWIYHKALIKIFNDKEKILASNEPISSISQIINDIMVQEDFNIVIISDDEAAVLDGNNNFDSSRYINKNNSIKIHGTIVDKINFQTIGCYNCRIKAIDVILRSFAEWEEEVKKSNPIKYLHQSIPSHSQAIESNPLCTNCNNHIKLLKESNLSA